jgi:hypothetical protein
VPNTTLPISQPKILNVCRSSMERISFGQENAPPALSFPAIAQKE